MSNLRDALSALNAGTGRHPAESADAQPDHTSGRAKLGGGDPGAAMDVQFKRIAHVRAMLNARTDDSRRPRTRLGSSHQKERGCGPDSCR